MEAAHILQYTEDEFLQTLDWRPHAKSDFHVCKKQQIELDDESKEMPNIEENEDDENTKEDKYELNDEDAQLNDQALESVQTEEFPQEDISNDS